MWVASSLTLGLYDILDDVVLQLLHVHEWTMLSLRLVEVGPAEIEHARGDQSLGYQVILFRFGVQHLLWRRLVEVELALRWRDEHVLAHELVHIFDGFECAKCALQ